MMNISLQIFTTVILGLLALACYRLWRGSGHPVTRGFTLPPKEVAISRAKTIATLLRGEDTNSWREYVTTSRDEEAIEETAKFEQKEAEVVKQLLNSQGILAEWWIRLIAPTTTEESVLVGVGPAGKMTFYSSSTTAPSQIQTPNDPILTTLKALGYDSTAIVRDQLSNTAQGAGTFRIRESAGPVSIWHEITLQDGHVQSVDRRMEVSRRQPDGRRRSSGSWDIAGAGAVLSSVLAIGVGIVFLIISDAHLDLFFSLALASIVTVVALLSGIIELPGIIAGSYQNNVKLQQFRIVCHITNATVALLYGVVVLVSVASATALQRADNADPLAFSSFSQLLLLITLGFCSGSSWLAMSAGYYTFLARRDSCRLIDSPPRSFQSATALSRTRAFLSAVVSATTEEVVFRFFAISLIRNGLEHVMPLSLAAILAVVLSAIAWSLSHSAQLCEPARFRYGELICVGMLLGSLFMTYGIIPSLLAHLLYNTVVTISHDQDKT